jgi:hypothetical protein
MFLSSRKYDLGCSSRIPDPDFFPIPDPDPGSRDPKSRKGRDPGSGSTTLIKNSENNAEAFKNLIFCLEVTLFLYISGWVKVMTVNSTLTNNELDILQGEAEIIWSQFLRKNRRMES